MIGKTVSHYRVTDKLGGGGMGVVYKAEDTRLRRYVALKFLPDSLTANREALERFRREARAASGLNHPHICVVHDIGEEQGQPFIVMEFLEGHTLSHLIWKGDLTTIQVIDLGLQISDALERAHARGIVHRDIKPTNIFVTNPGHAKILDFGLAKLMPITPPTERGLAVFRDESDSDLTNRGLTMGTIGYMSPEQARGKDVDHRSDLFSFGAVLYEMATSQKAFPGSTPPVIYESILTRSPIPVREINQDAPPELGRIIAKALEKDASLRYQTASDLRADLARLKRDLGSGAQQTTAPAAVAAAAGRQPLSRRDFALGLGIGAAAVAGGFAIRGPFLGSAESIQSIAVMPFTNLSGEPATDYVCDALTQSIIDTLSQLPDLVVLSRNAVARYKGPSLDIPKIRNSLKVHGVLYGRVARQGGSLAMNVDLLDTRTQKQIRTSQYSLELGDLLSVQEKISKDFSETLRPGLTAAEKNNLDIYGIYQKARYYLNKRSGEGLKKAVEYFNQVIEKNPTYALAHAGLADCYNLMPIYSSLAPRDEFPKAKQAAQTALELDEGLAEAHTALALVLMNYDRDWLDADREYKRALELDPNYETAHQWYAEYLTNMGRFDEAIVHMNRAQELAPLSLIIQCDLAWVLYCARRPSEALEQLRKTLNKDSGFAVAHLFLGWVHFQTGNAALALSELNKALALGAPGRVQADIASVQARSGNRSEALRILQTLKSDADRGTRYVSQFDFALIYAGLNDRDKAFEALQHAFEERPWDLASVKVDPLLDPLRSDPRFPEILRSLGLPVA